jgi:transposase
MQKVIDAIIQGERDGKKLALLVHGRTKNKHGNKVIADSLTGYITDAAIFNLDQLIEELAMLRKHEDACLQEMERRCQELYSTEVELLDTISGIAKQSAMIIIAELGVNLKMFATASALVGWLGLRPPMKKAPERSSPRKRCMKTNISE